MAFVSVLSGLGEALASSAKTAIEKKFNVSSRANANINQVIVDTFEQIHNTQKSFFRYQSSFNIGILKYNQKLEQKIDAISQQLNPESLNRPQRRTRLSNIITDTSISEAKKQTLGDIASFEASETPLGMLQESTERNFKKIFQRLDEIESEMTPIGEYSDELLFINGQLALIQKTQLLCCAGGMLGRRGGVRTTTGPVPRGKAGVTPSTKTVQTATATRNLSPAAQTRYQQLRAQGVPAKEALSQARTMSAAAPAAGGMARGALRTAGRVAGAAATPLAVGLGAYDAYTGVQEANRALEAGEITEREATIQKSEAVGGAAGGTAGVIAGGAKGAALGAAAGSAFFGVGAVPGAIVGGLVGSAAGFFGGSWVGKKVSGAVAGAVTDEPKNPSDVNLEEYVKKQNSSVDLDGLDPAMKERLAGLAYEYHERTGDKIQVNSAYRSREKQAELYARLGPGRAAPPGRSRHESGLAVDINSTDAERAIQLGLMDKYGFTRPVPGETWHVEPKESAGRGAPDNPYEPGKPIVAAAGTGSKPVDVVSGSPAPIPPPETTPNSSTPVSTATASSTTPTVTTSAPPAATAVTPAPTAVAAGTQMAQGSVAVDAGRAQVAVAPTVINNVVQAPAQQQTAAPPPRLTPLPEVDIEKVDYSIKASFNRDRWALG